MLEKLPKPPVTRDQLKMLAAGDNVVTNSDAVDTFGLPLVPLDEQLRRGTAKDDRDRPGHEPGSEATLQGSARPESAPADIGHATEQTKGRFRGPSVFGTSLYWQRRFLPKRRDAVCGHVPRAPYAG